MTTRSLRKPSGRKPGKQNGDPGSRLAPRDVPNEVLVHIPGACTGCGADLAELLVHMHRAVEQARSREREGVPPRQLSRYLARYDKLLRTGQQANPPPPRTGKCGRPRPGPAGPLLRRLDGYREDVLCFATDFTVPFDNNQAERDIRMIKLQQKDPGDWRTTAGARTFLAVRSYLSTAIKHAQSPLAMLRDLFTGTPRTPAAAAAGT